MGSHIPQESRNHIIVWRDPYHKRQWIPSNKIPSECAKLNSRGLIFSYTPYLLVEPFKRNLGPQGNSAMENGLGIRYVEVINSFLQGLLYIVTKYAKTV